MFNGQHIHVMITFMFEKEATEQVDLRNTHKTDAVSVKVQLVSINEQNYEKKDTRLLRK